MTPPKWFSIDHPEISAALEDDDIALCDECDGLDDECACCLGYALVHGYDDNGHGHPVVLETRRVAGDALNRKAHRATFGYSAEPRYGTNRIARVA